MCVLPIKQNYNSICRESKGKHVLEFHNNSIPYTLRKFHSILSSSNTAKNLLSIIIYPLHAQGLQWTLLLIFP